MRGGLCGWISFIQKFISQTNLYVTFQGLRVIMDYCISQYLVLEIWRNGTPHSIFVQSCQSPQKNSVHMHYSEWHELAIANPSHGWFGLVSSACGHAFYAFYAFYTWWLHFLQSGAPCWRFITANILQAWPGQVNQQSHYLLQCNVAPAVPLLHYLISDIWFLSDFSQCYNSQPGCSPSSGRAMLSVTTGQGQYDKQKWIAHMLCDSVLCSEPQLCSMGYSP